MKRSEVLFGLLRIPMDALAVSAALLLSYRLREARIDLIPNVQILDPAVSLPNVGDYLSLFVVPGILLFLVIAAALKLYALQETQSGWREIGNLLVAALLWTVAVMAWFFFVRHELFFSRILLLHSVFFIALFTGFGRIAVKLLQRSFLRLGVGVRLVVSVGSMHIAEAARVTLHDDLRYRYLGHVPDMDSFRRLRRRTPVDLVIQTDPDPRSEETLSLIEECRSHHIGYAYLPPVLSDVPHQLKIERLGLVPLVRFQPTPLDGWGRVLKRLFDIVVSVCLLFALSPFLVYVGVLIFIFDGWPIFYVSRRVGDFGIRRIPVLKFRTMVKDADGKKPLLLNQSHRRDGPLFKMREDPRVTKVGHALRRWSIDELPQLINVLLGHMSLVGPRPHLPQEVDQYTSFERRVFAVRPGITGLAQIFGRSDLRFQDEVRRDLQYIEEWSPLLDLWILWRTVVVVMGRRGAD